jgi:hypothetical protein
MESEGGALIGGAVLLAVAVVFLVIAYVYPASDAGGIGAAVFLGGAIGCFVFSPLAGSGKR